MCVPRCAQNLSFLLAFHSLVSYSLGSISKMNFCCECWSWYTKYIRDFFFLFTFVLKLLAKFLHMHIHTYIYIDICTYIKPLSKSRYKTFPVSQKAALSQINIYPVKKLLFLFYCHRLVLSVFVLHVYGHTTCTLFCPNFSTWCLPDLSMLLHIAEAHSFSLQCCILLWEYSTIYLAILVLMESWVFPVGSY